MGQSVYRNTWSYLVRLHMYKHTERYAVLCASSNQSKALFILGETS